MRILRKGTRDEERTFRFFCKCGCVWEAKGCEVTITRSVEDENNVEVICSCPCCGRIREGIGA